MTTKQTEIVHLAISAGDITASYNYDGYGRALNFSPTNADTSLLYAGEMYDKNTQQYYLRARWYSPLTGRFNRIDPFAGNNRDPQSLHKYLYAHSNPINRIDPTGQLSLSLPGILTTISIIGTIMAIVAPPIIGYIGFRRVKKVDRPADAYVVSFSASFIFPIFKAGWGGGVEGNYDLLWIKSLGRWEDYWAPGLSVGWSGKSVSVEGGLVWNVTKVSHYEKLFFSASLGTTPLKGALGPFSAGVAGSFFWSLGRDSAFGVKVGLAAGGPSDVFIYSATMSYYFAGGPFSWCRSIKQWFNDNVVPPPMKTPEDVKRFLRQLTGTP